MLYVLITRLCKWQVTEPMSALILKVNKAPCLCVYLFFGVSACVLFLRVVICVCVCVSQVHLLPGGGVPRPF